MATINGMQPAIHTSKIRDSAAASCEFLLEIKLSVFAARCDA